MRHVFAIIVFASAASAGVQYEDACIGPSEAWIYGMEKLVVDGDTAAMRYRDEDGKQHQVLVYQDTSSGWIELDPFATNHNISSIALHENTMVIGDMLDDNSTGCAYVYRFSDGNWIQQQKLIPSEPTPSEGSVINYGNSVAVNGAWAMVGPRKSESGVCLFKFNGQLWEEFGYLAPQLGITSFGFDLSLNADRLLVGSRGEIAIGWIYNLNEGQWSLESALSPASGIAAGTDVDLKGSLAILGNSEDGSSNFATIFRLVDSIWTEEPMPQYDDDYGKHVAIGENIAIVSSEEDGIRFYRVFQHNRFGWSYIKTLGHTAKPKYVSGCAISGEAAFICIDGNTCVYNSITGSVDDADGDGIPNDVDNCYLYNPQQLDCNDNGVGDVCDVADQTSFDCNLNIIPDECESDCDGDGLIDECDNDPDIDGNGIPDNCEEDCNGNGLPDDWEVENEICEDGNDNNVPDECECLADISDGTTPGETDGMVNVNDLLSIIGFWQSDGPIGDVNFDGLVNVNDLLLVIQAWGPCVDLDSGPFDLDDFDPLDMSTWPDGVETCDEMIAWLGNNIFANDPTTWPDGVDSEAELATWLIQMVTLLDSLC